MKSAAFDQFAKKVVLFGECIRAGRKADLSEAQTRLEYIDPLFRALGWDVSNERALNQFDREVLVEEAIEDSERVTKTHPDYTFRIAGLRHFFVEAKKPAVDIKTSTDAALQIRRYAWSAQLSISALTDFEEISVYDCTIPPRIGDDARKARSFCKSYEQYLDEWEELYGVLSREAVEAGALEALVRPESAREPFDKAFLQDLDTWRLELAKAIHRDNVLTPDELNSTTQLILDRLIFLRVAEAKGVKPPRSPSLQDLTKEPGPIYSNLLLAFGKADERYNSGLFHFRTERNRAGQPDEITPKLTIADKALKSIIKGLYPPRSPYAFSTVPADILGSVYERFLGKTITITPAGRVKIDLKPEVRKQGGVYYTPSDVVRYMVKTAIGQWIENHKLDELKSIRICDPACGSGAFLVAAYEYVVEAHIRRYLRRQDTVDRFLVEQGSDIYSLAIPEKKRILKDCIFGIDIDPAAVEITKLSLLLAVLEGETRESVDRQLSLFHDRPLPDLSSNVLCSNSLLESDDLGLTDLAYIERLKPLDWDVNPVTGPGFDVLLGNPPYVFGEWHHPVQLRVVRARLAPIKQVDLYHAFLDLVIRKRRVDGYWSLIVPDPILARDDTEHLRSIMLEQGDLQASHVGCVFADAAVSCVVLTQGPSKKKRIEVHGLPKPDGSHSVERSISFDAIKCIPDKGFRLSLDEKGLRLLGRLKGRPRTVGDALAALSRGEEFGKKGLGNAGPDMEPCVVGEDIEVFRLREQRHHIPTNSVGK